MRQESINNRAFFFLILLVISIPLPYAFSNISLGLFLLNSLVSYKKETISLTTTILLPIFLYGIMLLSVFWTIDSKATINAWSKEIFLLAIPLGFLLSKPFSTQQIQKTLKYYSYSIVLVALYFLIRSVFRYFFLGTTEVFFYHGENNIDSGLVPKLLNAIHVSVFTAIAFFYFLDKEIKTKLEYIAQILLFVFLILLSSKNVIIVAILLIIIHFFYFSKSANKMRLRNLFLFSAILIGILFFGKLKERFEIEINTNSNKSLSANVLKQLPNGVHNVSVAEAWTKEKFTANDYFPGTAFRVYQARMFFELMSENNKWLTGFGLNASQPMLEKKAIKYEIYLGDSQNEGYQVKNFHNQYLQIFAELGIFGFLLLIIMLGYSLKLALKNKNFLGITFTILMISLFLTESFLWRQRGVVFFTLFFLLFNNQFVPKKVPNKM